MSSCGLYDLLVLLLLLIGLLCFMIRGSVGNSLWGASPDQHSQSLYEGLRSQIAFTDLIDAIYRIYRFFRFCSQGFGAVQRVGEFPTSSTETTSITTKQLTCVEPQ